MMKKVSIYFIIVVILLGASGLTAFAATEQIEPVPNLFSPAAASTEAVKAAQSPAIARTRTVTADLALLDAAVEGDKLGLNLYPDVQFTLILERKEPAKPDGYTWVGRLQGVANSQAVLVVGGGQMAANISADLAQYQVRFAGEDLYAIHTIDQSRFPDELPPKIPTADFGPEPAAPVAADQCSAMDVMVVWTPAARAAEGGVTQMQNLVNLAVAETNQSYINSNMNQRINLAHMEEVSYTESADMATDLDRLTTQSDGYIDQVHTLRNTYYADLVSMFIEGNQYCGVGWMMSTVSPSFEANAFTVVSRDCATGYYSFAHEMGHNEGARHEWYTDTNTTPYAYAHGYAYIPGQWRTIMAYDAPCQASGVSCTRLQYWSNPGVLYSGVPMGVSGGSNPADNHLALNNTCSTVANFRDEPDGPGAFGKSAPSNGASGVSVNPTLSWGSSSGATSYEYCYDTSNDNACSNWTGNGTSTSKALSGLNGTTTYYWHVRANNGVGTTYSDNNTFWSFTTQALNPPGAFNKSAPANGATGVSTNPTISWGSSTDAASYEYCYDTSNDNACSNWNSSGTATSKMLVALEGSTTYYWHVRAKNGAGTTYSNSDTFWSFTTQAVVKTSTFLSGIAKNKRMCAPLFADSFGNASSGWPVGDSGNALYEYNNGEYRMLVRPAHSSSGARSNYQATNYIAEVDLRNPGNVSGSYGLGFGMAADFSTLYSLEIYPDGWYGLYRYDPSDIVVLVEATSPAIHQGSLANRIKVERNGSSIKVYANGQLLTSVTDSTYTGSLYIGLVVFSYADENVDIRFDNIAVYPLTCATAAPEGGVSDSVSPATADLRRNAAPTGSRK